MLRTAVITVASGRHSHLRRQQHALAQRNRPDVRVVVAMGDHDIGSVVADACREEPDQVVVHAVPVPTAELPLASARNAGAEIAACRGAELLVFLDVDCIPGPRLLARYREAAEQVSRTAGPVLLCGPVTYLAPLPAGEADYPPELSALTNPHPARPAPMPGELQRAEDLRLFWSLSFAMSTPDWRKVGGFDEAYTGYGAEDTDLGQRVAALGGTMFWVGGADAYHQWHPVSDPPVEHVEAIVRNANVFRAKWGWTPMEGWLRAFADRGLAEYDAARGSWDHRSSPSAAAG
ncbi:MAG: galactosyltransferase-related protein [Actinomycetota bacterium]|nr:galactosyltransferase-related protein [Actinomycetota bacterium]